MLSVIFSPFNKESRYGISFFNSFAACSWGWNRRQSQFYFLDVFSVFAVLFFGALGLGGNAFGAPSRRATAVRAGR